jgi:hypothetical protein
VLGVVLKGPDAKEKVDACLYARVWELKVIDLLNRAERQGDDPQEILENLLPQGWERVKKQDVLEAMLYGTNPAWEGGASLIMLPYLHGDLSDQDLIDHYLSKGGQENLNPVSEKEALREQDELSLSELLGLTT